MEELKKLFIKLGYSEEEFNKIINSYALSCLKPETLKIKTQEFYDFLISLGYSRREIIKMTLKEPSLLYSKEKVKQRIEELIELGYTREEIIKISKLYPIIYGLSIENIKQTINEMKKLGYSQEDVIKMSKTTGSIYAFTTERIKQRIKDMQRLGYTRKDVIKMTKIIPTIYNLNIETIYQKIEAIEKLGYSRKEVIEMTKNLPAIYCYSIEGMKQKIEFYDSLGLHSLPVIDAKLLMQSIRLSYARYMFYQKEKEIKIDETNFKKLFIGQKAFEKAYGITKEKLLEKYPYEDVGEKIDSSSDTEDSISDLSEKNEEIKSYLNIINEFVNKSELSDIIKGYWRIFYDYVIKTPNIRQSLVYMTEMECIDSRGLNFIDSRIYGEEGKEIPDSIRLYWDILYGELIKIFESSVSEKVDELKQKVKTKNTLLGWDGEY